MKYTLACSYKNSVWFWLNTDSWTAGDARYWFFPLCTLAVLLASHFRGRSLQHCPTGSSTQCIPTFLPMIFALTRWQDKVASPVPKIFFLNATLLSSANASKKLKLFPIPPCPYLKDSSYLQILLYSSENTKSEQSKIWVLKCETEGRRGGKQGIKGWDT